MIINTQEYTTQKDFPFALGYPVKRTVDMKVSDLTLIDCSVDANLTVREVAKIFEYHEEWPGVILKSGPLCLGLLSRYRCFEVLGKPFALEVFSRKTVLDFYLSLEHKFLVVDSETSIPDVVKIALNRDKNLIFDPVVVSINETDFRLINIHELLLAQVDVLENLYMEFHQLSYIDPLTQLNNRRGFFESAQPEVIQSQTGQKELSAIMIDIDNFKIINDLYGHFVGDLVLCAVADEIQKTLRQTDVIGRYGGEEFIGLLPNTSIDSAQVIAERLRVAVENKIIKVEKFEVSVTISIGVCSIADSNGSLDTLLSQADQAMYRAKITGRNRVSLWRTDITLSTSPSALQGNLKFKKIQKKKSEKNLLLSEIYDETIEGWSKAIELRNKEMEGHAHRVMGLTIDLAKKCGIPEKELEYIRRGALLHDIGKIAIPDSILFKPGKLTEDEWQVMRKHPLYAHEFLSPTSFLKNSIDIPYCHHEHWDGSGYPRGLKGEEIPLAARVFTIIDVWDALCSDRCYRPAWTQEEAKTYILSQSGKMFDPRIINLFIELISEKKEINE